MQECGTLSYLFISEIPYIVACWLRSGYNNYESCITLCD